MLKDEVICVRSGKFNGNFFPLPTPVSVLVLVRGKYVYLYMHVQHSCIAISLALLWWIPASLLTGRIEKPDLINSFRICAHSADLQEVTTTNQIHNPDTASVVRHITMPSMRFDHSLCGHAAWLMFDFTDQAVVWMCMPNKYMSTQGHSR